jgi:hypothetical protein
MSESKTDNKSSMAVIFNIIHGIGFAAVGFIITLAFMEIRGVKDKVDIIPEKYVQKQDYIADRQRIFELLREIGRKIDHNAEYMEADYNRRMDKIEKLFDQLKISK